MKKFLLLALLALPLSLHAQNDDAAVMTTAAATAKIAYTLTNAAPILIHHGYEVWICELFNLARNNA